VWETLGLFSFLAVLFFANKPMNDISEPVLRNVSDTALWVAIYRARETERPDAVFKDPFARRLAGDRGEKIAGEMQLGMRYEWPFIARTVAFDRFIKERVAAGADTVLNLAAGLDTRPYRLDLPADLKWVEVDMPSMIDYKEENLAGETPRCRLERVRLDLREVGARRELFHRIGADSKNTLVITEGLIIYLSQDEVTELARHLAAEPSFKDWITDLGTPALLKMLQKSYDSLEKADAQLKFAPENGPDFFKPLGWKPVEIYSSLKTAAEVRRLPFLFRILAMLPDSKGRKPKQVWGGAVRLTRA